MHVHPHALFTKFLPSPHVQIASSPAILLKKHSSQVCNFPTLKASCSHRIQIIEDLKIWKKIAQRKPPKTRQIWHVLWSLHLIASNNINLKSQHVQNYLCLVCKHSTLQANLHSPPFMQMQHVAQHVATGTNPDHHRSKLSFRLTWWTSETKFSIFTEYPNPAQDSGAGTKHLATKKTDINETNQYSSIHHSETSWNIPTCAKDEPAKGIPGDTFPIATSMAHV